MKKKIFLLPLLLVPALAGCGGDDTYHGGMSSAQRSVSLTTTVNVTKIKRGFIVSSGKANEVIDYSKYAELSSLSIVDTYFLVYEFDYYSRMDTDGHLLLKAALEFDAITIFNAYLFSSDSGTDGTPIPYKDPVTNKQKNKIVQTFRVPAKADEIESQRIVFKITPSMVSAKPSTMQMNFYPEEQSGVEVIGSGAAGCTIPMQVDKYKLDRPQTAWNNRLEWQHVKGAEYYQIFVNDESLKNQDGTEYKMTVPEELSVGDPLSITALDIEKRGMYGTDLKLQVRAFSTKAGLDNSDFSKELYATI